MGEVAIRLYIGMHGAGNRRLATIRRLAKERFKGSVSALFNNAINQIYDIDPETGEQRTAGSKQLHKPPKK